MPFRNRIRLVFTADRPQYKETRDAYRRADGKTITQSVIIQKILTVATDWWPERWHENFKIALASDTTTIETDKYFGDVAQNGDYQINWQDRFNRITAPAEVKVEVNPFDATNSNCQTCEEAQQVDLNDVVYPTALPQGTTQNYNVLNNNSVCCYPAVFSIIYYNPDIVSIATIDNDGNISITLKSPIASFNHLKVATFRVTCPNGSYDEGDVYADISGAAPSCLAPLNPFTYQQGTDNMPIQWTAPSPAPVGGYHIDVYASSNPGSPVFAADTLNTNIVATGLTPGTAYIAYISGYCGGGVFSNNVELGFNTLSLQQGGCGQYSVTFSKPEEPAHISSVTYIPCTGTTGSEVLLNGIQRIICVLEYSPGNPVDLTLQDPVYTNFFYIQPC